MTFTYTLCFVYDYVRIYYKVSIVFVFHQMISFYLFWFFTFQLTKNTILQFRYCATIQLKPSLVWVSAQPFSQKRQKTTLSYQDGYYWLLKLVFQFLYKIYWYFNCFCQKSFARSNCFSLPSHKKFSLLLISLLKTCKSYESAI